MSDASPAVPVAEPEQPQKKQKKGQKRPADTHPDERAAAAVPQAPSAAAAGVYTHGDHIMAYEKRLKPEDRQQCLSLLRKKNTKVVFGLFGRAGQGKTHLVNYLLTTGVPQLEHPLHSSQVANSAGVTKIPIVVDCGAGSQLHPRRPAWPAEPHRPGRSAGLSVPRSIPQGC